jgi:hypothetical protein
MDLGKMRRQGLRGFAVYCLNHACLHRTVINVDDYPGEVEVSSFRAARHHVWSQKW